MMYSNDRAQGTAFFAFLVLSSLLIAPAAFAKVPEQQAERLGNDLTPMGSEKAGNADGTIPSWTGGLSSIPPNVSYKSGQAQHANPFKNDRRLFTITPQNMAQYKDKLTPGYQALFSTYDDSFTMPVYKSRRTCALPDFVYKANTRNARVGQLVGNGNGVSESIMGSPFPIPNSALEMIWNHTLRYRSFKVTREQAIAAPTASGQFVPQVLQDEAILRWSNPEAKRAEDLNNISLYFIANTISPPRRAGTVILVYETLNRAKDPRKAWQYSPGTRRVRRAPNIGYDNPIPFSDGLMTSDSFDGYNGAPNRFDWTFLGKSEKYISYNNYETALAQLNEIITPSHLNRQQARYELHRVWSIEARLKPTARHVYSRRVKHLDEDAWRIATAELYDGRGELWRIQEMLFAQFYEVPLCGGAGEVVHDLQVGRYVALALRNGTRGLNYFADELNEKRYTPASIRRLGKR